MTTLFDIDDEIELTMKGKVKSFSISNSGDCYIISLRDKDNKEINCVYLDSQALIMSNARKVGDN